MLSNRHAECEWTYMDRFKHLHRGYPLLHQEGVQNVLFSWLRIIIWMMNGACSATIIFFMTMKAVENQAFRRNGQPAGYDVAGTMMYNCIVWTVNCQMALSISYFTWIQHVVIWGSIVFWYIFLLVYGSLTPSFSTTAFRVLVEKCAPSFMFWFMSLLIVVTALLLYFSFSAIRMAFFPSYHSVILWNRHNNSASDPGEPRLTRPGSLRPVDIGFSALVDSKMRQLKEKIKPKQ